MKRTDLSSKLFQIEAVFSRKMPFLMDNSIKELLKTSFAEFEKKASAFNFDRFFGITYSKISDRVNLLIFLKEQVLYLKVLVEIHRGSNNTIFEICKNELEHYCIYLEIVESWFENKF